MFDITKLALKIPNFLTHEECDRLIDEFEQRKNESYLESSLNYKTNQYEESLFKVISLLPNTNNFNLIKEKTQSALDTYLDYLEQPKYFFTEQLRDSLRFSHAYRIMKYGIGAEIHPHSDHAAGTYGSISFNLNEGYEGGVFNFFNRNYSIELKKGDALIFPADFFWVHEVTPVTKGVRYSLNSFIMKYPYNTMKSSNAIGNYLANEYIKDTHPNELLGPYN